MSAPRRPVAEAGREMARYDARGWIGKLRVPAAVICPRQDELVPPQLRATGQVAAKGVSFGIAPAIGWPSTCSRSGI